MLYITHYILKYVSQIGNLEVKLDCYDLLTGTSGYLKRY